MGSRKTPPSDNFEEGLKKLEDIVQKMEEGQCSLDEALSMFEEGVSISKKCSKLLDEYERKIMIVKEKKTSDGSSSETSSSECLDLFEK